MNDNNDVPAETTTEVQQLDSGNSSTNNSNNSNVLFDEANDKYENEFKSQMTRHSPAGGRGVIARHYHL